MKEELKTVNYKRGKCNEKLRNVFGKGMQYS